MPEVPRYDRRRVAPVALPSARLTAAETPLSQGAGLARAEGEAAAARAEGLGRLGQPAAELGFRIVGGVLEERERERRRLEAEERDRADDLAVLRASNDLAAWKSRTLYDEQAGAFAQKGEAAFQLPEAVNADFLKVTGEIGQTLGNDRQRLAWEKFTASEWASIDLQVRRHVYGEMSTFRQQELEKGIANATDDAIRNFQDPRFIGRAIGRVRYEIETHGPEMGMGKEAIDAHIRTVTSGIHTGVISQFLSVEQFGKAEEYLGIVRDEIAADKLDEVTKAVEEGGVRKTSQQKADEILRAGGTLQEQRDKAKAIQNPRVRDDVLARIEHEATVQDRIEREADEQKLKRVYDTLDAGRGVAAIPAGVWSTLTPDQRSSARSYARNLAEGVPVKTDDPTFYRLMVQARDDPDAFTKVNMLDFRSKLSSGDFQQLAGMQLSFVNAARAEAAQDADRAAQELARAANQIEGFRTKAQILDQSLAQYGMKPEKEPEAVARLFRILDRHLEALSASGVKVTPTEIQAAVDALLSQPVTDPGSWWNIFPGGKPFFEQRGKRLIDVTINDVPVADRQQIEARLRARGRTVTPEAVLQVYIDTKALRDGGDR